MKKILIIAVVLVVVGLVGYFGYKNKDKLAQMGAPAGSSEESPSDAENLPLAEVSEVFKEPVIYSVLRESYTHTGFSFKYSEGFKVSSSPVETGEMVTVENSKGSGFQIFIMAFDEPGPITPERIWQDMPGMKIDEPKNADLDGSKTLVFNGYDEDMGETFEAWTVRKGKLYQIVGPRAAEQLITETLNTWSWK